MTFKLITIGALALALAACDKAASKKPEGKPTPPSTVAADGTRSVPISVRKAGYDPDKLTVKAGEKLKLVFTRVEDTECGAQVKVADGALIDLPLGRPVEVALTAPPSGEIRFACGMDMMTGVVVVN